MATEARRRRGYWIPAVIAMVVLLAIAFAVGAGDLSHPAPRSLNGPDVADQIATAIQVSERSSSLPDVRCPASEPVRAGFTFDCSVARARGNQQIHVTEQDGRGRLGWTLGATEP